MHLQHDWLDEVLANESIIIYEVSNRLDNRRLPCCLVVPVQICQGQLVLVVILLHVGGRLPPGVGVETGGVLLHHDHEDALLLEGGVEGEDAHQDEVGGHTSDQNWSGEGERVEEVPKQSKHRYAYSHSTNQKSSILSGKIQIVKEKCV